MIQSNRTIKFPPAKGVTRGGKGPPISRDELQEQLNKITEDYIKRTKIVEIQLQDQLNQQKIKMIEFLGIFVAILSFVAVTTQGIFSKFSFQEVIILLPLFAIIFLIFVVGIDLLITERKVEKFGLIILLLTIFFLLIFIST